MSPNEKEPIISGNSHELSDLIQSNINQVFIEFMDLQEGNSKEQQASNKTNIDEQIDLEFFEDDENWGESDLNKGTVNAIQDMNSQHEFDSIKGESLGPIKTKKYILKNHTSKESKKFTLNGLILEKMPNYNGLKDEHLQGFFFSDKRKLILIRNGLITPEGFIIRRPNEYLKKKELYRKTNLIDKESSKKTNVPEKVNPYVELKVKIKNHEEKERLKYRNSSKSIQKADFLKSVNASKNQTMANLLKKIDPPKKVSTQTSHKIIKIGKENRPQDNLPPIQSSFNKIENSDKFQKSGKDMEKGGQVKENINVIPIIQKISYDREVLQKFKNNEESLQDETILGKNKTEEKGSESVKSFKNKNKVENFETQFENKVEGLNADTAHNPESVRKLDKIEKTEEVEEKEAKERKRGENKLEVTEDVAIEGEIKNEENFDLAQNRESEALEV